MTRLLLVTFFLAALVPLTFAANILIVMPMPARSHSHLFAPLAEELAGKGHNVTYFTAIEYKKTVKNLKQILAPMDSIPKEDVPNFFKMRMSAAALALYMPILGSKHAEHILTSKTFQELINNEGNTFDLIIMEAFVSEGIAATVTHRFKAPLIGYATFMPSYWMHYMVGNEAPTSYVPDPFTNQPRKMSFCERLWNFIFVNFATAYHLNYHISLQENLVREHVKADMPHVGDIVRNTSLMLVNDDFALSFPRPLVPNIIPIGGLHVKPPKPLPSDLQKVMDKATNGVVFFSLGSNLKSADMDEDKINMFLTAIGKLKETVIWKFEKDLPNKPKNLIISDWLPQSDILAHPNLKLFITHGGLLSTTESVERGVPLVGIPIFGDQPMNMRQSVNAGVGVQLDYDTLSTENIYEAIREVIDNPKYKEAALSRSRQLRDKPMSAMDTAVYWIEYVLRHKGAPHLRSAAMDLAWYQVNQLDVVLVLAAISLVALCVTKCVVKKLLCLVLKKTCSKKQAVASKKKDN